MKAGLLITGNGALVYLTSHSQFMDDDLKEVCRRKGITKYIAYEVPVDRARERYGNHFDVVLEDIHESDDMRILDFDGSRVFNLFPFKELGKPVMVEPTVQ